MSTPQLRLLAPKGKASQPTRLAPHNTRVTDGPAMHTANVKLQHPVPSPVSSGHGFTSSSFLSPNSTVSNLERKQYAVVPPCTNIYSNSVTLTSANGVPELAHGNLLSGARAATHESFSLSTQHAAYGNLQLGQGQDYWIPTLAPAAPEVAVWTAMAQPTVHVHQSQCPIHFLTR